MKNSFTLPFTLRVKKVVYSLQSHVLLLGLIGLVGFVGSVYSIQKSKIVLLSEPSVNHTKYSPSPTNSVMNTSQFRPLLKKAELMANPSGVTTTPTVVWNSFFQGTAQAVTSLVEGGYVAAGYTYSTLYNKSSYNFIVVRVDEKGKLLWQKILGGSTTEYAYAVVQTTDGGIIVAGQTDSNDGDVSGNHGLSDGWLVKLDKDGNLVWTKAIGGSSAEFIMGLTALADGGVMGAGWGYSTDGNRSGGHGSSDFWVFRMDADGNVIWSKSFGGYYDDHADAITSLKYGQFAVFGYTYSNDGDVSGNHGSADYWVIKIDFNGQLIWQKALGGSATDWGWGGIVTSADDGLVMAGLTYSNDGDVSGSHSPTNTDLNGTMDYWVVKLNNDGQLIWQRVLGGSADDRPEGTMATSDGGYIVVGQSKSNDGDVSGNHGNGDAWLVKLNDNGNLQWQKPVGGSGEDFAWTVAGLSASSFVIAGTSNSTDGDINQTHDNNFWLAKLETPASSTPLTLVAPNYNCQTGAFHFNTSGGDGSPIEYRAIPGITDWTTNPDQFVDKESRTAVDVKPFRLEARQRGTIVTYSWDLRAYCSAGTPPNLVWQRVFGGASADEGMSIAATSDGNFVAAGRTMSNDGDVTGYHGGSTFGDFWVVKVNPTGKLLWQKALGGLSDDYAFAVTATSDGGCIVAGYTDSNDGDVSGNHGASDFWVVRLNSEGTIVWQKAFGGTRNDRAFSMAVTSDGNVVVAGFTNSSDGDVTNNHGYRDFWVIKISGNGDLIWQRTIGGAGWEYAFAVTETTDGSYVVAGRTAIDDGEEENFFVAKLNSSGDLLWQKTISGPGYFEQANALAATPDGGCIVSGNSNGFRNGDAWVMRLTSQGDLVWQKNLGGSEVDNVYAISKTEDGGYVLAGVTSSTDGDIAGKTGGGGWLFKLSGTGDLLWQKPYGYLGAGTIRGIVKANDGSFMVTGSTESSAGELSNNHGGGDLWIARLGYETPIQPLELLAPNYNCQTGAFHFNTSGGDGSPIEYRAIPGITDWTTNPDQFVDKESRTAVDVKPFRLEARQRGTIVTYSWDLRAYCDAQLPLQLLSPSYDCQSGAIHFNTRGGDGSPIEFMAIGITGWTTNPNQYVDRESRTASDVQPFTLLARQGGVTVSYVWDLKVACGRARIALDEKSSRLNVVIMGNPLEGQTADIEIQGVEGKTVGLKLVDQQGHILHKYTVPKANLIERVQIPIGNSKGLLLLEVTTDTERQQLKMIKP